MEAHSADIPVTLCSGRSFDFQVQTHHQTKLKDDSDRSRAIKLPLQLSSRKLQSAICMQKLIEIDTIAAFVLVSHYPTHSAGVFCFSFVSGSHGKLPPQLRIFSDSVTAAKKFDDDMENNYINGSRFICTRAIRLTTAIIHIWIRMGAPHYHASKPAIESCF